MQSCLYLLILFGPHFFLTVLRGALARFIYIDLCGGHSCYMFLSNNFSPVCPGRYPYLLFPNFRIWLANLSLENITQLVEAYRTGMPILNYSLPTDKALSVSFENCVSNLVLVSALFCILI